MSARAPQGKELQLSAEPRVQLLPPSVRKREKARETRRLLVLLVLLSVTVVGAGMAFGGFRALTAQAALSAAQARTQEILVEQAQYSEVSRTSSLVATTKDAQRLVTANEIDWVDELTALAGYLPAGATFDTVAVQAPAPWEPPLATEGPLRAERIGVVTLTVGSADYATAAAFVAAVAAYEAVADVSVTGSLFEDGHYKTTVVLTLNETARTDRFLPVDEGTDEEDDDAEQSEASATEGVVP